MGNLVVNSSYDFDSTIALALVLHVWKHNDLRKVTCLFQRILWLSYISVSTHIMKIDSHDYIMFFFHIQYFIGRHRYPLVDCWWYHYSSTSSSSSLLINNRQLIVLFSASRHKIIPTCAFTTWYTFVHSGRRLFNNIESLCSYLYNNPSSKT